MPFHTNQLGLGKRRWNLETFSAVVEFLPLYFQTVDPEIPMFESRVGANIL